MLLSVLALGGGAFVYVSQTAPKPPPAPPPTQTVVEPPPPTIEPPPPPTYTVETPPSASAAPAKPAPGGGGAAPAASIDPASRAYLDATQLPPGRKIIVDGRVVGTSPRKVPVRCGVHRVQIEDQAPESIDFPCGGEVNFTE